MGRKIVVSSNCQTGGLTAALAAMLPDDTVVPYPWVGENLSEDILARELRDAEAWVTVAEPDETKAFLSRPRAVEVIRVPRVLFGAFHPDTVYMAGLDGEWIESPVVRMHSAIVVWGWRHGLSTEEIVARFTPSTMERLGYTSDWDAAVARLRRAVERTDIDFASFFLPLRQGLPFMLTVNHPRIGVMIQMARQVARRLGADEDIVEFPWENVLVDGLLTTGPAWPVYPAVAQALGLRGGFVWRQRGGTFLQLEQFVSESLERYRAFDPNEVVVPALDAPVFDSVLRDTLVVS